MRNYSHTHFVNHFKAMGYSLLGNGICAGLAQMSIQAFLAGREEFARFNQRLEVIAASSPAVLSSRIRKARAAIAERSRKKRVETKLSENELVIVDLSEEEELLTEMEAFFGGVEAYQHPRRHREPFAKLVNQSQVHEIIPFIESTALIAHEGLRVADSFPGIYTWVELSDYFNRLTQIILHYCPPCDIAMGLDCINHRISLLFDSARGVWFMIDSNSLPSREITCPAQLADAVIAALAKNTGEGGAATKAAFNTTVYATGKNEAHVKRIMAEVKNTTEFKSAHEITLSKVNERTEVLKVSLADIAAKLAHLDVLKAIAATKVGALNEGGYSGSTPIHTAAGLNIVEVVKMLADEKVSFEAKDNKGRTPLAIAITHKCMEVMTVLLNEEKGLITASAKASGWLPVHVAAGRNNAEAIKLLKEKGADPMAELAGGFTPVMIAAANGCVEALKALIALVPKAKLEKTKFDGGTALMLAAWQGHAKIVECLAEEKIDLNKRNRAGNAALHLAVQYKHLAAAEALILGGATVDVVDFWGNTPLHLAAKQGDKEIFDFLIKHGASVGKQNRVGAGKTPLSPGFIAGDLLSAVTARDLMLNKIESLKRRFKGSDQDQSALEQLAKDVLCCYQNNILSKSYSTVSPEVGLAFVAAKNDNAAALRLLPREEIIDFEAKSAGGWLLMHVAVISNSKKIIDAMLSEGRDLTLEVKESASTVVNLAAGRGLTKILREIISKVPVHFLNKADINNATPLYTAVDHGHDQAARLLIRAGVDVNLANNSGYAPLHRAIERDRFRVFKMLLKKADLNQEVAGKRVTPVALAAMHGRIKFLRLLIGKVPAVDIRKKSLVGATPLIYAVKYHQAKAAKMLINALDAEDLNEKDNNGEAALHIAIQNNDIELVEALLARGADVNLGKEPEGKTPVQLAVLSHQVEIVSLLRIHGVDFQKRDGSGNSALSTGSPFADALARKMAIFSTIDAWIAELRLPQPGGILSPAVDLEFTHLKQLIEKHFDDNYEVFLMRYGEQAFGKNDCLLIAFIAAEKGYKNILELSIAKIDVGAKNPAGLTLSQVAEVNHHSELVRILQDHEEGHEHKQEVGLPLVGLFAGKTSVPLSSLAPKEPPLADSCYVQLKEQIMAEAKRIATESEIQPRFSSAKHRVMLKCIQIQQKLDECDKVATKKTDKYQYLKAQCEDKLSLLYHALHIQTGGGAKSAVSPIKNVLDKIAELDASLVARELRPEF